MDNNIYYNVKLELPPKDEIKDLESQLDVFYKEKNTLENEIIKLPGHPKTL